MKKHILFLLILFSFFSCKKEEKTTEITQKKITGFYIYGKIPSFEGKTILLQEKDFNKNYKTLQKATVKDNKFEFKGSIESIQLLYLGFENFDYKIPVLINNFETSITIDPVDLDQTKIIGSNRQKEYSNFLKELKTAKNKFVFKTKWIKKHQNSPLSAIILYEMLGKNKWRLEQNQKAYQVLSDANKKSAIGKEILNFINTYQPKVKEEKIEAEFSLNPEIDNNTPIKDITIPKVKPKKSLPKRKKAPNFYAESLNGNDISLNEVKKNATVTLIDFWASWCAPCRASNPHLVKLYKKYHKNGFQIISVSEDNIDKKHLWKNAIQQDGLIWQHVIDDDARVATMFGVKGIPHTVLLDANGGIIFVKKTPYTIEKKLKEIFGY